MRRYGMIVLVTVGSGFVVIVFARAVLERLGVRPTFRWREWAPSWNWFFNPVAAREVRRLRGKRFFLLVGIPAVALLLAWAVVLWGMAHNPTVAWAAAMMGLHITLFAGQAMAATLAALSLSGERNLGTLDELRVIGLPPQWIVGGKLTAILIAPAAVLCLSGIFYIVNRNLPIQSGWVGAESPYLLEPYGALPIIATLIGWASFGLACSATARSARVAVPVTLISIILLRALFSTAMVIVTELADPLATAMSFVQQTAFAPLSFNMWADPNSVVEYKLIIALGWTLLMFLVAAISFWFAVRRLQQRG